jgi:hypothetical protein
LFRQTVPAVAKQEETVTVLDVVLEPPPLETVSVTTYVPEMA